MSDQKIVILQLLASERRWWYGLELIKASDGRLGRGTIYVYLHDLIEDGLVDDKDEEHEDPRAGMKRRLYRITEGGMRALSSSAQGGHDPSPVPA